MTSTLTNSDAPTNWEAPDDGTWELESAHGGSIPSVPFRAAFEQAFAEGFRSGFAGLGLPLSHIELRHVNGWPYVSFFVHDVPRGSGKPPPDFVLKAVSRIHPGFRRRTKIARLAVAERRPQAVADHWFNERDEWVGRLLDIQRVDTDSMPDADLASHLRTVADTAARAMQRHFELVPGSIPVGEWLNRTAAWGLESADSRKAVMYGTPIHDEATARLQRIVAALGERRPNNLDELRAVSDDAAAALDDYLDHHGWWATEDSSSARRVCDFPDVIMAAIHTRFDSAAAGGDATPKRVLAKLRDLIPENERALFDQVAADAHRSYTMLDDNSGILGSWMSGIVGHTLRTCGERLVQRGRLSSVDHAHALELDDIAALLDGSSAMTADGAADRHKAWLALGRLDPPPHLNGPPGPPPSPDLFPTPVAQLVAAVGAFLADKFNYERETIGIGSEPVTGRAVVARDASDALDRLEPGDILVTIATSPAYMAVLPIVAGIVVSEGGASCHTAVVARELEIPALVGYTDAFTAIPDGALIELDPIRATVRVVNEG